MLFVAIIQPATAPVGPGQTTAGVWELAGVMLICGVAGGVVNFMISGDEHESPGTDVRRATAQGLARWLVIGIVAAFMVPLFLQTISSKLVEDALVRKEISAWLAFIGFCLVAAVSARAFINTLTDRVLAEVKDAKRKATEARDEAKEAADRAASNHEQIQETKRVAVDANRTARALAFAPRVPVAATVAAARGNGGGDGEPAAVGATATGEAESLWESDPHKGYAGGKSEGNGRKLTAEIRPLRGAASSLCQIHLEVRSTDPNRPLKGSVTFRLHPTFEDPDPVVEVSPDGVARLDISAWEAFTVGADADGGQTKLEIDLNDVEGGSPDFYYDDEDDKQGKDE